jgi:(1->4)-alpha-D-glucan 1-alpha-D-glucosylmutase
MDRKRPPRATYRLQFNKSFTFRDAEALLGYLDSLGVSHVYASPLLKARPGSPHGYDIVDHTSLNPEIGSEDDFRSFVTSLHRRNMGLIMDFVPNHMGVNHSDNAWWLNVLEWGQASLYADFFDIDWEPSERSLHGKLLLPVLGKQYGETLHAGELSLRLDPEAGTFSVYYYDHRFPIAPPSYRQVLGEAIRLESSAGGLIAPLRDGFGRLKAGGKRPRHYGELLSRSEQLKEELARLYAADEIVRSAVDKALAFYNGIPGEAKSFDALHRLLEAQAYRAAYWRLAANEINYRRFFDINDLAGIRMERDEVFGLTHELVLRLLKEGALDGLRLDHIDGLQDPRAYLNALQDSAAYRRGIEEGGEDHPGYLNGLPMYLLVEKILAPHEQLREDWPVHGTTGYEFMGLVGEVLTDPRGEEPLTDSYHELVPDAKAYDDVVVDAKYRVMVDSLASELNVLANQLSRLAKGDRRTRDYSRLGIRRALADVIAHFPVYRTYVDREGSWETDRRDIDWAIGKAAKLSTMADRSVYEFLRTVLVVDPEYRGARRRKVVDLAMKTQQLTSPVTAKAEEDTAFYRYVRFLPRCEVGSRPNRFYSSPQAFHLENKRRGTKWPFSLLSTATHDHKRGEDLRCRLNVLSEVPDFWFQAVSGLREISRLLAGQEGLRISAKDEYLLYQTIVGAWPPNLRVDDHSGVESLLDRVGEYAVKAARESKMETTWTGPNDEYEGALRSFLEGLLSPEKGDVALRRIEEAVRQIEVPGIVNSLSQTLLKLTVPGVPDIYQGCESWDFSLVDPDNRRPVDFSLRRETLSGFEASVGPFGAEDRFLQGLLTGWRDGRIKSYVVWRVLSFRRGHPDLFSAGEYLSLDTRGDYADNVLAFLRRRGEEQVLVVVPRLVAKNVDEVPLPKEWGNTTVLLPEDSQGDWENIFDKTILRHAGSAKPPEGLSVSEILHRFPVALLSRHSS